MVIKYLKTGGGSFRNLILNKGKRLLIPSIIFSAAYLFLLGDPSQLNLLHKISAIARGYGHLWFLPMLFMCFVSTWIIHKLTIKPRYVIPALLILSIGNYYIFDIILGYLDIDSFFMLYFYCGFCIKAYRINPMPYATKKMISLCVCLATIMFVTTYMLDTFSWITTRYLSIPPFGGINIHDSFIRHTYAIPGLAALYLWSMRYVYTDGKTLSRHLQSLVGTCFGVYLFQEFILKIIYYHTNIPSYLSPYALPWIGFIVALSLSLILSKAFLATKIGRWLIG